MRFPLLLRATFCTEEKKLNSVCVLTVSIAVTLTDQYMSQDENWPVSF